MKRTQAIILCDEIYDICQNNKKAEGIDKLMSFLSKNKIVRIDKTLDYECKGQMDITDYPEYLPDDYEIGD